MVFEKTATDVVSESFYECDDDVSNLKYCVIQYSLKKGNGRKSQTRVMCPTLSLVYR